MPSTPTICPLPDVHFRYCKAKAAKWTLLSAVLLSIGIAPWIYPNTFGVSSIVVQWVLPLLAIPGLLVSGFRLLNFAPQLTLTRTHLIDHRGAATACWEEVEEINVALKVREGEVSGMDRETLESEVIFTLRDGGGAIRVNALELDSPAEWIGRAAVARHLATMRERDTARLTATKTDRDAACRSELLQRVEQLLTQPLPPAVSAPDGWYSRTRR